MNYAQKKNTHQSTHIIMKKGWYCYEEIARYAFGDDDDLLTLCYCFRSRGNFRRTYFDYRRWCCSRFCSEYFFSNLAAGSRKLSSEVYYIEDEDAMLKISSATWDPASQNIWIGWYNVDTGVEYYVEYTGGDISSRRINSNGVPDGDYKIFVKNVGTRAVTGALQYSVN